MSDPTVATTIRQQIGTDAWLAVSARQPAYDDRSLMFGYGASGSGRKMVVQYERGRDTYTVKAYRVKRRTLEIVEEACYDDVYADSLPMIIRTVNDDLY